MKDRVLKVRMSNHDIERMEKFIKEYMNSPNRNYGIYSKSDLVRFALMTFYEKFYTNI